MKRTLIALALAALSFDAGASFYCAWEQWSESRVEARFDYVTWTVGQPAPVEPNTVYDSVTVSFACAANGAELDYIRAHFASLPMRLNDTGRVALSRTVVWDGDAAHFILDNL